MPLRIRVPELIWEPLMRWRLRRFQRRLGRLDAPGTEAGGESAPRIHPVWFSCGAHFAYLRTSVASLGALRHARIGTCYVYADPRDPLSDAEIRRLRDAAGSPVVARSTRYRMSWGGPAVIMNEILAFRELYGEAAPADYLAKVDSDLLFVSSRALDEVADAAGAALVGKRFMNPDLPEPFEYTQGGCYFVRCSDIPLLFASSVADAAEEVCRKKRQLLRRCPEDAVIYTLFRRATERVRFIDAFVTSCWFEDLEAALPRIRERGGMIHFEGQKDRMLEFAAAANRAAGGRGARDGG